MNKERHKKLKNMWLDNIIGRLHQVFNRAFEVKLKFLDISKMK